MIPVHQEIIELIHRETTEVHRENVQLDQIRENIANQRLGAKRKAEQQAEAMLKQSAKRYKPAQTGDSVMVPIPDVDRGRADFLNLKGVVMEANSSGLYKIGTEHGILNQLYSRNQFAPTIEKFMSISDVPEISVSLREATKSSSIGLGQGFFRCSCTTGCTTKRCKCRKANKLCNSRCHSSNSCNNK